MSLNKLKAIYGIVNKLGPNTKTIIIMVLLVVVVGTCFKNYTETIFKDYTEQTKKEKCLAEEYTKIITPYINRYVEDILVQDQDASNVLLLNYHNTVVSTNGLSYRYLTSITERKRGFETKSCLRIWKELEYVNYGEELEKINENKSLRINNLKDYEETLPNLIELLKISGATSAAFYPLQGVNGSIGMLVVIYKTKKQYPSEYYQSTVAPSLQPLCSLLDYNSIKDKFKKMYENGQIGVKDLIN